MNKIVELMKELGKSSSGAKSPVYYNANRIIQYGSDQPLWMVFGERRIGKTHFFTQVAFELYKRYGWQTAMIRNKKVEFKESGFQSSFLNAPIRFGWATEEWKVDEDGVYDPEGNQVILFQALSTYSNARGNEHPNLHFIFMDEVQREDGRSIKSPHKAIMSLCQTFFSGKSDCLCVLASNRVSATNMMFLGFKIYPEPKYAVTVFKDKGIALETCRKGDYKKDIEPDNPFNKVYRAGGYGDYADSDEDDLMALVKNVPKGAKPVYWYTFLVEDQLYRGYSKDAYLYFTETKEQLKQGQPVYTDDLHNCVPGVMMLPNFIRKDLKEMIDNNMVRFSSANVMMAVISLVYAQDV